MHLNFRTNRTHCNTTVFLFTNYTIMLIQQIVKSLIDLIQVADDARNALFSTTDDIIDCFISFKIIHIRSKSTSNEVLVALVIILK